MTFAPEILAQHLAVLGKTGSGKTSTAKLLIEQVVATGARVCILDPLKSDWWGLTSSRDGRAPGLPFHILGGPRGHVPLHAGAGAAIAGVIASGAVPHAILDMADFEPGGQAKFFVDFASTLLKQMRGVVYLVLEEAHLFAPKERSGLGAENLAIHWAKTLATAGRSKGIRLVLVTQRTQALHNALLGSCDTLIAHRLTAPADQAPVVAWLKANTSRAVLEQVSASLASLKTGEAWLCAGEAAHFARVRFPRIVTYDNTATPTDDGARPDVTMAPVDLDQLRALVGTAVAQAQAADPAALRRRISALEQQLATAGAVSAPPTRLEVPVLADADLAHLDARIAALDAALDRAAALVTAPLEQLRVRLRELTTAVASVRQPPLPLAPVASRPVPAAPRRASAAAGGPTIGKGERAILTAVAQHAAGVTREQLTVLTGYKRSSRDTYLQRLAAAGYVTGTAVLTATTAGVAALGPDFVPLPTGAALRAYWLDRLPVGERTLLEPLLQAYPSAVTRDDLSARTGYQRSSRDTYLQRLAARRLIQSERGGVRASATLFD